MISLHLVRAAVIAAAGAAITLAQLNLPSKQFWGGLPAVQWVSVFVVASFTCYDAIRSVSHAVQAARIRDYEDDLRAALSTAVSSVIQFTGAPWDELTVRYYRQRGVLHRRHPTRVGAVQAGAGVMDAQQSVRPGVGVVGTAFSEQVILAEEWQNFVHTATNLGPDAWMQCSERARYGLSWGQLRRSAQPDGVVASPTFGPDGNPNGCILLSGPLKMQDMDNADMRRSLDDLATTLDLLGPPPSGWWSAHER